MRNLLAALLILKCFLCCSFLQQSYGQSQFQLTIGGAGNEFASSVIQTTDGGYALVGTTFTFGGGNGDFYIVKIDESGSLQWTRTVGGTNFDEAWSIIQTADGGYIAAGTTQSFGAGGKDFYIVKLEANGTFQWDRTVGGKKEDRCESIRQTTDGGYIAAGRSNSFGTDVLFMVKFASNGTLQWSRTVQGADGDAPWSVIQTAEGAYVAAGTTFSFGAGVRDMLIIKLDPTGILQWSRTVGGGSTDVARSITQTADGGYAICGASLMIGGPGVAHFHIVKLDSGGTRQWSTTVGTTTNVTLPRSIIKTADGGYTVAGLISGIRDMYLVKLDQTGTFQWDRFVGGTGVDSAMSVVQTPDGGYLAAGSTNSFGTGSSDMYIVKLDTGGNTCANFILPTSQTGTYGTLTTPTLTLTTPNPRVTTPTANKRTISSGGSSTVICIMGDKIVSNSQIISTKIPGSFKLYQNYPNPFNPKSKIKYQIPKNSKVRLSVFDVLGHEISELVNREHEAGSYEITWDASDYPSGVYYYKLSAADFTETKKMVLIK